MNLDSWTQRTPVDKRIFHWSANEKMHHLLSLPGEIRAQVFSFVDHPSLRQLYHTIPYVFTRKVLRYLYGFTWTSISTQIHIFTGGTLARLTLKNGQIFEQLTDDPYWIDGFIKGCWFLLDWIQDSPLLHAQLISQHQALMLETDSKISEKYTGSQITLTICSSSVYREDLITVQQYYLVGPVFSSTLPFNRHVLTPPYGRHDYSINQIILTFQHTASADGAYYALSCYDQIVERLILDL